jgi:DNA-binding CsgD family transcriptional regulator
MQNAAPGGGDLRSLFRLVGEAGEELRAGRNPCEHALRGLMDLTGAQIAGSLELVEFGSGKQPRLRRFSDHGWATDSDRTLLFQFFMENPVDADPLQRLFLRRQSPHETLIRTDLTAGERECGDADDIHRQASIGDSLLSMRWGEHPGEVFFVFLKRALHEPLFGARERELVHLLTGDCLWMFAPQLFRSQLDGDLSRRERETLSLLLTGVPEKQIALMLGLSQHTAHVYVKAVYRKLAVTSRGELMARALERDPMSPKRLATSQR